MARLERLAYRSIYRGTEHAEQLPWHHEELPELLDERLAEAQGPLRVLDVGCGAGTFAVQMAERGHDVTGIDFVPRALELARERALERGVELRLLEANALEWASDEPFDLVFDSGCLHSFRLGDRDRYKRQLLQWLGADADYVLVHFAPLFPLDWRPIGPRRRRPRRVRALLGPELVETDRRERVTTAFFPVGPRARLVTYRFRRS